MRRFWSKALPLAFSVLAASALTGGCADSESMMFVRGVLVPDAQDCTYTADPSSAVKLSGTLDVELAGSYEAGILVGNQLTQRGERNELKTETNRVSLRGAEVRILTSQQELVTEYTVLTTGFVDQAGGSDPAYGVVGVTLIDQATADAVAGAVPAGGAITLISNVKVFGTTLGGKEVDSNELQFPITVCRGCLVARGGDCGAGAPLGSSQAEELCPTKNCELGQEQSLCCACDPEHSACQ